MKKREDFNSRLLILVPHGHILHCHNNEGLYPFNPPLLDINLVVKIFHDTMITTMGASFKEIIPWVAIIEGEKKRLFYRSMVKCSGWFFKKFLTIKKF